MYPKIISIGPLTIYSFGVMVALAFLCAGWLISLELKRSKLNERIKADSLVVGILLGGLLGAKIYYIIINFRYLLVDPWGSIFSGSGLVWHGGFIGAILVFTYMVHKRKLRWLQIADLMAPALAIGYAIGRIGCLLSGDGDYGKPSDVPWAMSFPHGTVPTMEQVHPTPIYEALIMIGVFIILWMMRKRERPYGFLFGLYLILSGAERFIIEFWRINPISWLGLTQAQIFSLLIFALGAMLIARHKLKPKMELKNKEVGYE